MSYDNVIRSKSLLLSVRYAKKIEACNQDSLAQLWVVPGRGYLLLCLWEWHLLGMTYTGHTQEAELGSHACCGWGNDLDC